MPENTHAITDPLLLQVETFAAAQAKTLRTALGSLPRTELEDIIMDVAYAAHGSLLEEDYEGNSDTLGEVYEILADHGLRPSGNSDDLSAPVTKPAPLTNP